MKIEAKISYDYMCDMFDFGINKFCFDLELSEPNQFEFGTLNKRFRNLYREELRNYVR